MQQTIDTLRVPISIHAPLTGSDELNTRSNFQTLISIHAPLTGSDLCEDSILDVYEISIHAPLTGSDNFYQNGKLAVSYFNPRSPHRERQKRLTILSAILNFNPRSPHRERLNRLSFCIGHRTFQSTLPSQGATANIHIKFLCDLLFSTLSSKNSFTLSRFPQTIT